MGLWAQMCAVLTLLMACRFARFEVARQEVLQLLAKPTRSVGAVAKMQLKEEALKAAHADFIQADQALVDQIEAQQQGLGGSARASHLRGGRVPLGDLDLWSDDAGAAPASTDGLPRRGRDSGTIQS